MRIVWASTLGLALAATASPAALGAKGKASDGAWSAKQVTAKGTMSIPAADLVYGGHQLQVTTDALRIVIDFRDAGMTYIDDTNESWARVTLDELAELRKKQLAALEQRVEGLPPKMQESARARLAEMKASSKDEMTIEATDETSKVAGRDCQFYRWSSGSSSGRACLTTDVPFDLEPFRADSRKLASKLKAQGAGGAVASLNMLRMGAHGFPVLVEETMTAGGRQTEVTTRLEELRSSKAAPGAFSPPEKYRQVSFLELLQARAIRQRAKDQATKE